MIRLREWQKEATAQALQWFASENEDSRYFILNVAPGAGKTLCASHIANELIKFEEIERVIIIAPRSEVVSQWAQEFKSVTGRNATKVTGADTDMQDYGLDLCATWAAVKGLLGGFQQVCEQKKTLVICDEHHHAAVEAIWGKGANDAFAKAKYILLLTGTPMRGDGQDAVWLAHDNKGRIDHPAGGIYTLTYGESVGLEYCRPITFHRHEGKFAVDLDDGEIVDVSSQEMSESETLKKIPALQKALEFYRLACTPQYEDDGITPSLNSFQATMLQWGVSKLNDIRLRLPTAGGLVIAPSIPVAEYMTELLEKIDGEKPILVHSRQTADPQNKIKAFRNNDKRWIVSIAMISEGVDIPRLRVLVYLPHARTELAFRQAMGRVVRKFEDSADDDSRAYVVMPTDEIFNTYARRVEEEMPPNRRKEPPPYPTKKCPVCSNECPRQAERCDSCGHEFPPSENPLKACAKCGHLNPINVDMCENCGESFKNTFNITLKEALRLGVITRGWDISEEEAQWGEENEKRIRDEIMQSGDPKLLEILMHFPPESFARIKAIFNS